MRLIWLKLQEIPAGGSEFLECGIAVGRGTNGHRRNGLAVMLERSRISADNLFLYTAKTETPVTSRCPSLF
jgi:hypothetical protein